VTSRKKSTTIKTQQREFRDSKTTAETLLFFLTKEAPSNRTVVPTSRSSDVSAGTSAASALAVAALLQTTMSNRALALVESSWRTYCVTAYGISKRQSRSSLH